MAFDKFKFVPSALPKEMCDFLTASILISEVNGDLNLDKEQVVGSTVVHGYSALDVLMLKLLPLMEKHTGYTLLPTYSFARIYRKGDELKKHTDRPACEVSTTLTLGYISKKLWPIYADNKKIVMGQGDMLIYKGCEVEHWRNPFDGDLWVQVFLHYVDANGPYKEHAFDKRPVGDLYETIFSLFLRGIPCR